MSTFKSLSMLTVPPFLVKMTALKTASLFFVQIKQHDYTGHKGQELRVLEDDLVSLNFFAVGSFRSI